MPFYNAGALNQLPFSNAQLKRLPKDTQTLLAFWTCWMQEGSAVFCKNCSAEALLWVDVTDEESPLVLPVLVQRNLWPKGSDRNESYTVSLYNHYIQYAIEELTQQPKLTKGLRSLITIGLKAVGYLLKRTHVDDVVYLNNLGVSTNLYPTIQPKQLNRLHEALRHNFPKQAWVWRSLHAQGQATLKDALLKQGGIALISRYVYHYQPYSSNESKVTTSFQSTPLRSHAKANLKRDRLLQEKNAYAFRKLNRQDVPAIKDHYDNLYLHKYSFLNPQWTSAFYEAGLCSGWLQAWGYESQGRLIAVFAYFGCEGVITTPILGYDLTLPITVGLYRLISLSLMQHAEDLRLVLHQSSGAGEFKRCRGFQGNWEYSVVQYSHLSLWRRLGYKVLHLLLAWIFNVFSAQLRL
jgi:hypothetical protein